MTLRCIVGRILQEPIQPAERDAAAELADALHDALDSTTPGVVESKVRMSLAVPGLAGWERWQVSNTRLVS